jgi:glutamyl-tRNA synthetase
MAKAAHFYFTEDVEYDHKAASRFLSPEVKGMMQEIRSRIAEEPRLTGERLEIIFAAFLEEKQIKLGAIAQPLRVALTGSSVSPGLFEVMEVLGKEAVLRRIDTALAYMARREKGKNP